LELLSTGPEGKTGEGPWALRMDIRDETDLGLAVHWVQQALISAYDENCTFSPFKKGRKF
jgi:hypothetical protein